uniref:Thioredoxin domain-containing protein n=1 Tax=viral metagenome TaxID=1070528 RepID=A0A6C0JUR4_9ZZZZ
MAPKLKKASKKHHNSVHVKSSADLVELQDFLKKNKRGLFLVVVMMEGCPHCVTLERDVIDPLLNNPNRRNGIARIQHTELENTPLKHLSKTIRGYPTVIKVENGETEEVENPRDVKTMNTLAGVTAEEVVGSSLVEPESETATLDEEAEEARENNVLTPENLNSLLKKRSKTNVPNVNADVLNSQNENSTNVEFETPTTGKGSAVGGSLYASLLSAGKDLAPAAILSVAAIGSRLALRRKSKRSKRSKRKTRSKKD